MKLRKLMMLLVVFICAVAFCVPAYAANIVELPLTPTIVNNDSQKGWCTDGMDNISADLTMEQIINAKYLVLEFGSAPVGGMQFIWQGDGDDYAWNQTDGVIPDDGIAETSIVIDIAATAKNYEAMLKSTKVKIFLGYYSNGFDDLKITRAYLTDVDPSGSAPAASTSDSGEANPKTGDNFLIYLAVAALAVASCGVFVFCRKAKTL